MKKLRFLILLLSAIVLLGSCSKEDAVIPADADDNFITALSLSVDDDMYIATIEGQDITVSVPYTVTLTSAVATIEYTPSATIDPDPVKETIDWNREQVFRVTSYNGATNEYTYRITRDEIEEKGDVVLRTMTEIEAFQKKGTSVIDGNLTIGTDDGEDITSIEKLSNLKSVSGNIILKNSFKATDLTGLEQVTKIGGLSVGTEEIPSTAVLNHVSMPKLTEVTGNISIWNNNLKWMELKTLTKAGGILLASELIENIELPELTEIGNDFIVEGCLKREFEDGSTSGYDPPALKGNLEAFSIPNLQKVGGTLGVNFIAPLKTIALPKLKEVGNIDCEYLPMAFETIGLEALRNVDGNMKICSVKAVAVIGGYITYNDVLTSLGDLSGLEKVGGVLTLTNFGALTDISMPSLKQCGGIWLEGLSSATTLAVPAVEFTAPAGESLATVRIETCPALEKLSTPDILNAKLQIVLKPNVPAFENKTTISEVELTASGAGLNNFTFTNWEKVEGNFSLVMNVTTYRNAISFPDLKEVGGYLNISWKKTAPNFRPTVSMPNLESVGGQLYVMALVTSYDFSSLKTVCCANDPAYANNSESTPPVGSINIRIQTGGASFPALTRVGGKGLAVQGGNSLSCPALTDIDGTLVLNTYKGNNIEMPKLGRLGGCYFYNSSSLSDFTFFGKFIENGNISEENWTVTGCAYNPTWRDMKEGRYTPAE